MLAPISGCGLLGHVKPGPHDTKVSYHDDFGLRIEYPEATDCPTPTSVAARASVKPLSLEDPSTLPTIEMSLEQVIQQAVTSSPVLRNIGGTQVNPLVQPTTVFDPAATAANPITGVEAALSAFDAQYTQSLSWSTVDTPTNTLVIPGVGSFFPTVRTGRTAAFSGDLTKRTATGATFALRHIVNYDALNVGARAFQTEFNGWLEAEWRQPLMRGAGTTFNRIAGPGAQIGQYNGVLIARVNEDIALSDFENAVITLVADVEQAYWDLALAYRVLEATAKGRESALQTFQYQQVRLEVGAASRDEEAQARSQYYQFEAQVQNALGGPQGLYELEQRLRYLIGMPSADGNLIRPTTSPTETRVIFDWDSALSQALTRRVEIRRQRFNMKRREFELVAARLNRRPQLDLIGSYRWNGLGDHLIGDTNNGQFDNFYDTITDGDFQQLNAGVELSFPVGLRQASVAVSAARLNLQRERAVLAETELSISHTLANASRAIDLTHQLVETNYNRLNADLRQVDVLGRRYRDGTDNINFLLQAQRQLVTSEQEFYRALIDYNLAIRDFHQQKGSLLAYNGVQLAEGPWVAGAYQDAYRVGRFLQPRSNPSAVSVPRPVTRQPFDPSAIQSTGATVTPLPMEDVMIDSDAPLRPSDGNIDAAVPPVLPVQQ